jgi:hypothetical protein
VNAEHSLAIVSEISVPNSKSKGVARFTNLSQGEVNIPAGIVVSTESSISFATLNDTRLSAGIDQFVDVPIEAMEAGMQGNVVAEAITIVKGSLGLSISVTNPDPTKGGANSQLIGATDEDRAKLREVVMDNLRRAAESKLRAQIAAADLLLMDTFDVTQIIEENFAPPEGQPGKTLILTMQVEFSSRYVLDDDLSQLSLATLNASVENGFKATASPVYKVITNPSTDNAGVSHFELEVTRTLLRQVDEMQVFSIARGHKPESIKDELVSKLSLREAPQIAMTPSWWKWLPLIPFNISINTQ